MNGLGVEGAVTLEQTISHLEARGFETGSAHPGKWWSGHREQPDVDYFRVELALAKSDLHVRPPLRWNLTSTVLSPTNTGPAFLETPVLRGATSEQLLLALSLLGV